MAPVELRAPVFSTPVIQGCVGMTTELVAGLSHAMELGKSHDKELQALGVT